MTVDVGRTGCFDFGLDEQQEARAQKLHRESIIMDMVSMYAGGAIFDHYPASLRQEFSAMAAASPSRTQLLVDTIFWPFKMAVEGRSDLIREWVLASGLSAGAFDIDIPCFDGGDPLASDWDRRLSWLGQLDWIRPVTSSAEIRRAKADGVLALFPFYQPVVPLLREVTAIDRAYARGLRWFMLTYNRMDHVGIGCTERVDAGLSLFGVQVVERCNALGIIVDVSHCGRLTTLDACRLSRRPVTANHSAAKALYPHPRSKSDQELSAVADTGGVIGVLAVPYFLTARREASIEILLDHIDYIANLVGWQHVGLGTDWPIQAPDEILLRTLGDADYTMAVGWGEMHWRDVTARLDGFNDCRDFPNITRGLVARGYSDDQVRGILGENALRVFADVVG